MDTKGDEWKQGPTLATVSVCELTSIFTAPRKQLVEMVLRDGRTRQPGCQIGREEEEDEGGGMTSQHSKHFGHMGTVMGESHGRK